MFIKQLYTNCLSEAAYYIESEGEAAIIDPMRDIEEYRHLAEERNATIKYIFETHFHADFVSGHIDLSKATGAPIVFGPETKPRFSAVIAKDGQTFSIGKLKMTVLHTPGHTIESTCYLLADPDGNDHAVFTGDTLFVGDVGRPDLSQGGDATKEEMAALLYNSLQNKIMPLADHILVYPAHGAGSSCGKSIDKDTHSTIGEQKQTNYALNQPNLETFVQKVTEGLAEPPVYFPVNARINREGYDSIDQVLEKALQPLTAEALKNLDDSTIILDTRPAGLFTQGFVPGSVFIGLEGNFAEWAGTLLPFNVPLALVAELGKEREAAIRLARVGFSKMAGFLHGGFDAWKSAGEPIDLIIDVEPDELAMDIPFDDRLVIVDVRKPVEYADGHVKDAVNIPLSNMTDPGSMANIEDNDNLYLHCGSGFRSLIAASLLKRQGIHNLRNVTGGYNRLKDEPGIETEKDAAVLN